MSSFVVSSAPHVHSGASLRSIMFDVIIALLPATAFSIYAFGLPSLLVIVTAIASALVFEAGFLYLAGKKNIGPTIFDGSGILTALLLALNLPSASPLWMVVTGSFVAIVIAKQTFGGLGYNIFNPALVARVFLLISFPVQMTNWVAFGPDGVSAATPLGMLKTDGLAKTQAAFSETQLAIGQMGGSLGETSALLLLAGALYLLWRKVISWDIPFALLAALAVFTGIFWLLKPESYASPLFHLLTGGAVLGAFFMATDMVTSPVTRKGRLIFGLGIGLLTGIIRLFGGYPEGISFAILIMNALVPLIDRYTRVRKFGI